LRNQVLLDLQSPSTVNNAVYRLVKLSDTQVMVLRGSFVSPNYILDVSVLEINSSTNVITRVNSNSVTINMGSNTGNFTSQAAWGPLLGSATYLPIVTYKRVNQSNVLISIPNYNNAATLNILKINWNNTTKVITSTNFGAYLTGGQRGDLGFTRFLDAEDGSGIAMLHYSSVSGLNSVALKAYSVLTTTNIANIDTLTTVPGNSTVPTACTAGSSAILNNINGESTYIANLDGGRLNFYQYGAVTNPTVIPFTGASTSSVVCSNAFSLSNDNAIIFGPFPSNASGDGWNWVNSHTIRVRIINYKNLQCTSPTFTPPTISFSSGGISLGCVNKFSFAEKIDNSTIVLYGYNTISPSSTWQGSPTPINYQNHMCALRFLYIA
jgi:hypothetical protein